MPPPFSAPISTALFHPVSPPGSGPLCRKALFTRFTLLLNFTSQSSQAKLIAPTENFFTSSGKPSRHLDWDGSSHTAFPSQDLSQSLSYSYGRDYWVKTCLWLESLTSLSCLPLITVTCLPRKQKRRHLRLQGSKRNDIAGGTGDVAPQTRYWVLVIY